ncbi:Histidine kinase-, DNA gyrase B-, and HSP90-like ATPase [Epsilonproteobacteria bacterium SCGC AD-308-E02]|nr:Histidine kinase-, DNA gyrase B-, and HSP90-like ATPase [Epsilonproteobacteria bacterium SCGC AD-308-E02]
MFKTLIGKFTFFFWLIFLISNILIYFFGAVYIKNLLINSEENSISLMLNTLKPVIAFDISFDQEEQLNQLLNGILEYKSVKKVQLNYGDAQTILKTKETKKSDKLFSYKVFITDPFSDEILANIDLSYSNENINNLQKKILTIQFFIFIFTLFLFFLFFIYVKQDLNALRDISNSLQEYSESKIIKPIILQNKSQEITTIANVANEMISHISQYIQELKSFNTLLEYQVNEEIQKVQKQEKIIVHQSRQAAMGKMLESIAHQWRQPLNIIGISVANLEVQAMLGTIENKDLIKKLQLISLNTNYMSDTIDDFRNFLSPNRNIVNFNLKNSIGEVLTIMDAELQNKKIKCTIKEEQSVNSAGVENEFKQVIFILIHNAKDAVISEMEKKKRDSGNIFITISQKNNTAIIDIEDNGGGIEEDIIPSIFDPYFSTKFASQGTGIGLYMAKNIIESRMQGTLSVKNTQDGCCFTIELPNKDNNT